MRKTILLIGIYCGIALLSFGQNATNKASIIWGEEMKESKATTLKGIVAQDETGIYTMKSVTSGLIAYGLAKTIIYLEHFDNNMEKTKSVELDLAHLKKKKRELELIAQFNGELYLFSSFVDKKLKRKFIYRQTIDKNSLHVNQDKVEIDQVDYSSQRRWYKGAMNFSVSPNGSKMMIHYPIPMEDKKAAEVMGLRMYDNKLNELWEKRMTVPYDEEEFSYSSKKIDNDGSVYLFGFKSGKAHIYQLKDKATRVEDFPITLEEVTLKNIMYSIDDSNDILSAGFYAVEEKDGISGSFCLKLDGKTKKIVNTSLKPFDLDFLTQTMSEREAKKAKKKVDKGKKLTMYNYELDEVMYREDGGAYVIGEQFYIRVVTSTYTSNGNTYTTTTYYYYYNDIIVINIDPEGNIVWVEKVAKKQATTNDGGFYSSYHASLVNDKLYFIFNDNVQNLDFKSGGTLYNFTKSKASIAVLVELDINGQQTREALFSTSDVGILARPKVCSQVSSNEMVLFGQRKKTQRYGRVSFRE